MDFAQFYGTEDYFFDDGFLHQSSIKKLLYMTPKEFFYSEKKKEEEKSDSLLLGTALHRLILQPQIYKDTIFPLPELPRNSRMFKIFSIVTRGCDHILRVTENKVKKIEEDVLYEISSQEKDELDGFLELYKDTIEAYKKVREYDTRDFLFFKQKDFDTLHKMKRSIEETPDAVEILNACSEFEKVEEYSHLGLNFRRSLDGCGDGFVLDLKTSNDPAPRHFKRAVEVCDPMRGGFGYALQAASYLCASKRKDFYFIVVGNKEPHECFVYKMTQETLDLGLRQFNDACQKYSSLEINYAEKPNKIEWI